MHEGTCPTAGSLGECAIISQDDVGLWQAVLYIWDASFHDSTHVAQWFHDAGANEVFVTHVLYDSVNDDRNGQCIDGGRAWWVHFRLGDDCDVLAESSTDETSDRSAAQELALLKHRIEIVFSNPYVCTFQSLSQYAKTAKEFLRGES